MIRSSALKLTLEIQGKSISGKSEQTEFWVATAARPAAKEETPDADAGHLEGSRARRGYPDFFSTTGECDEFHKQKK